MLPSGISWSFVLALPTGTDGIRILCNLLELSKVEGVRAQGPQLCLIIKC